jgi:hypothetical protein
MNEKITKIEEIREETQKNKFGSIVEIGFIIETEKQIIKILIGEDAINGGCCERSGYLTTNDNINDFIGSEFMGISVIDMELKEKQYPARMAKILGEKAEAEGETTDTMFVNITTSIGLLQFVAYNIHNGYYGHNAKVIFQTIL